MVRSDGTVLLEQDAINAVLYILMLLFAVAWVIMDGDRRMIARNQAVEGLMGAVAKDVRGRPLNDRASGAIPLSLNTESLGER